MLPHDLSDKLCSLAPHVDRLCFVADMVVTGAGIDGYRFAVQYLANKLAASREGIVALRHSGADVDQILGVGM